MSIRSLIPDFCIVSEVTAAMQGYRSNPLEAIQQLKDVEASVRDRKRSFDRAQYGIARAKLREACDRIESAITDTYQSNFEISWQYGLLLSRLDQDERALDYIDCAIELREDDPVPYRKAASVCLHLGRKLRDSSYFDNALDYAEDATDIDPSAKSLRLVGDAHRHNENYEEARKAYITGVEAENSDRDEPGGYMQRWLSEISRRHLRDLDTALKYAEQAYAAAPSQKSNVEEYGYALLEAGETHRALPLLLYANVMNPQFRTTVLKLTDALVSTGDHRTAILYAQTLETACGKRDMSIRKQIEIARKSGSITRQTFQLADEAVRKFRNDLRLMEEVGRFYYEQGMFDEAVPILQKLVDHKVKNADTLSRMITAAADDHTPIGLKGYAAQLEA